ncbi:MAG: NfeD family protein [Chloroflexota bacterium]|nr:MAG: NfeD family protein [Chloroflexota bacterium]
MEWWVWLFTGLVLLALELLTPGALFLVFFGAGAIAVGLLSAIGLGGPLWLQILLFALLSLAALFTLRRLLLSKLHLRLPDRMIDRLVGETALALEDIAVDGVGKAELRGSTWNARNVGEAPVSRGQRCTVMRVEGLTLWIYEE